MEQKTEQNRARLLSIARGVECKALLYNVGYTLLAIPAENVQERTAVAGYAMPCEYGAIQSICDAIRRGEREKGAAVHAGTENAPAAGIDGKADMLATWRHYEEDADDEDIREAMAHYPCLVNYGGTLRAHNTGAGGTDVAVILKDMAK